MKKRFLTATLCIVLLVCVLPPTAKAVSGSSGMPTVSLSVGTVTNENTIDVEIFVENNPGIITMILEVGYDASIMTLTKVTDGGILGTAMHTDNLKLNPYQLTWSNGLADSDYTSAGLAATLTFKLSDDIAAGTYPITLACSGTLNYNLDDVPFVAVGSQLIIPEQSPLDNLKLSALEMEQGLASVRLTAEQDCTLIVALYTADGKMVDVGMEPVTGSAEEQMVLIPISSGNMQIFTAQAFLLGNTSYLPLCQTYSAYIDWTGN